MKQLALLLLQASAVAGILLALFRLRTRLSLCPLYVALGVFQPIQVLLAASIHVEVFPGVFISPGSAVMFAGGMFALLVVYIREDASEARKVIYALTLSNLVVVGLYLLIDQQIQSEDTLNTLRLPAEMFQVNARVMGVGTIVLLVDALLVIVCYEALRHVVARPLLVRAFVTLALVLAFDSLVFSTGAFIGTDQFQASLVGGLVGKTMTAGVYAAAMHAYFRWIEPAPPDSAKPMGDLFETLTYRERYAHAKDEAQRSKRRFLAREAAILEAVGDGVLMVSSRGEILELNPAARDFFGCDREDAIGQDLASWVRTEEPLWGDQRESSSEPLLLHDVPCEGPSGKTTLAEVTVTSTRIDEDDVLIVCVHDSTDLHEVAEQRRRAEMLAMLGAVAGGVAHDFNNILTIILGSVTILKMAPPDADEELVVIENAVERAAALTRQLLALGRKGVYSKQHIDTGEVVRDLEGLLTRVVREDVVLSIGTPSEVAPIYADPSQVEQILLNLVVNAADAMPDGGRLTIDVSVHLRGSGFETMFGRLPPGTYVCIAVRDSGVGMTAEQIEQAFEMFFTTRGAGKGTGLGLSTVNRLVTELQGGLRVESSIGEGTLFEIWLPAADGEAIERGPVPFEPDVQAPPRRESILVCDDDVLVGRVARDLLRSVGFEAQCVHDPQEALRRASSEPFDVLITDMVMPAMSGRDLAAAIRKVAPAIRVIFVSGHFEEEAEHRLDSNDPIVSKPFSIATLTRAIVSSA